MAAADYASLVQELYISYFGRPADPRGLGNFEAALDNLKAPTDINALVTALASPAGQNTALKTLINNSFSGSAEAKALYNNADNLAFVGQIYKNVLNRTGDTDGLLYWAAKLDNHELSRENAAIAIMQGALANTTTQGLLDAKLVTAKVAVATNFTTAIDTGDELLAYMGDAAAATARGMLGQVTSATDAAAFQATVDATLQQLVTGSIPTTTFNLTSNADIMTGTAGNDVFVANPSILSTDGTTILNTLQAVDNLNGGLGNDTLKATFAAVGTVKPILASIETVQATFNAAATLDLSASADVTTLNIVNSTANAAVNNVGGVTTIGISGSDKSVTLDGSTATTLAINASNVGANATGVLDLGATAASKAKTLNVSVTDSDIQIKDTTGGSVATAVSVAATGTNAVTFTDGATTATAVTVTGSGSVDLSGVAFTKAKTLTAGDGGVKFDATGSTATTLTVTTGAGADTLTLTGANLVSATTGAGNDSVTLTTAADVATVIDLGAGDDTLTLSVAPTAGATLTGGAGFDTISMSVTDYNTVSGYTAAQLAKITGFEALGIASALANGAAIDLSKIAGLTSFQTVGVAAAGTATVTNVGSNATVTANGDLATNTGKLVVTLKDATGSADSLTLNLTEKAALAAASSTPVTFTVKADGVENLTVNTAVKSTIAGVTDAKAPFTLALDNTNTDLAKLVVTGTQKLTFVTDAAMTKLATLDGSANTGGVVFNDAAGTVAATIKGSATAANTLTGGAAGDTIVGGAKADTITGGAGGDTLTGGAGNDTFVYASGNSSIGSGTFDTITDFAANTYGSGTNGAAGKFANADATTWTGDVLAFTHTGTTAAANGFKVFVASNAADATTFLANTASASNTQASAALDSSGNNLYVDVSGDGVADFYIHLTGVSSITAAAFTLA